MSWFGSTIDRVNDRLEDDDREGHEIEYRADVEASKNFVKDPGELVEGRSLCKFNISSWLFKLRRVMHNRLQLIIHLRLKIHGAHFYNDLEGDKVLNSMIDGVLEWKQGDVDKFC